MRQQGTSVQQAVVTSSLPLESGLGTVHILPQWIVWGALQAGWFSVGVLTCLRTPISTGGVSPTLKEFLCLFRTRWAVLLPTFSVLEIHALAAVGAHSRCAYCNGGPILDVLVAVGVPFKTCLLQWGSHSRCACCNGGPILDVLAAMGVPF